MAEKKLAWPDQTREKFISLGTKTKAAGANPLNWDIPRSGILSKVFLSITGSIAGTLSAQNALGFCAVVNRIRILANNNIALVDIGPASVGYLLPPQLELRNLPMPTTGWNGRTAITATTFDISTLIPISFNSRDPLGLVNLQNPDTTLQVQVEFAADASVATGATVTATVELFVETFTMPLTPEARPDFSYLHVWQEESQSVAATGDVVWYWPRGNVYCSVFQGLGLGAAGTDGFTRAKVRINGGDYLFDASPAALTYLYSLYRGGAVRAPGLIPIDYSASSGIGDYGSTRDFIDTMMLTDIASVVTASATGTLYTLKRMLVPLFNRASQ